jgi:uncharacterized membrane protein
MRRLWNIFLKGLVTVLPAGLTLYAIFWLGRTAESMLGSLLRLVLPEHHYRPGMGLLTGFAVVMIVGVLVNAYVVRRVIRVGESQLARIPLVKTIYAALKDLTRFLPAEGRKRDVRRVVAWRAGSARVLGFVTEEHVSERAFRALAGQLVAVYFPMSYQIGGYTLFLPREELEETDLTAEEAMRLILLGGISAEQGSK